MCQVRKANPKDFKFRFCSSFSMDASAETAIEGSDDKAEDHHVIQDGDPDLDLDLELDFAKMGVTGKAPEFYNDS